MNDLEKNLSKMGMAGLVDKAVFSKLIHDNDPKKIDDIRRGNYPRSQAEIRRSVLLNTSFPHNTMLYFLVEGNKHLNDEQLVYHYNEQVLEMEGRSAHGHHLNMDTFISMITVSNVRRHGEFMIHEVNFWTKTLVKDQLSEEKKLKTSVSFAYRADNGDDEAQRLQRATMIWDIFNSRPCINHVRDDGFWVIKEGTSPNETLLSTDASDEACIDIINTALTPGHKSMHITLRGRTIIVAFGQFDGSSVKYKLQWRTY